MERNKIIPLITEAIDFQGCVRVVSAIRKEDGPGITVRNKTPGTKLCQLSVASVLKIENEAFSFFSQQKRVHKVVLE